jgi:hypothetical protein
MIGRTVGNARLGRAMREDSCEGSRRQGKIYQMPLGESRVIPAWDQEGGVRKRNGEGGRGKRA